LTLFFWAFSEKAQGKTDGVFRWNLFSKGFLGKKKAPKLFAGAFS
jgi:hypothetical protein